MLTIESQREMIEAEIDRLIGLLDRMDGDPDFEDGHDAELDAGECGIVDEGGRQEQMIRCSVLKGETSPLDGDPEERARVLKALRVAQRKFVAT